MIRMLLVGYCYGIRHERRLCQEVALHLAYRWFCKLDLDATRSDGRRGKTGPRSQSLAIRGDQNNKTDFFDSIGQKRRFRRRPATSGLPQ
jgi:hypothetical protein